MDKNQLKKKALVYVGLFICFYLYIEFVPSVLDYYVCRPDTSYIDFYYSNILSDLFQAERVVIGAVLLGLYFVTANAGVSAAIVSVFLFALTHASFIKYEARRELLRLADLKLSEMAGMAANYIRFQADGFFFLLVGVLLVGTVLFSLVEWANRRFVPVKKPEGRKKWAFLAVRILTVPVLIAGCSIYLDGVYAEQNSVEKINHVNLTKTDANRYVLYRFLKNDEYTDINVEHVEDSYAFFLEQEPARVINQATYPNVIVVMNESWWDTDNVSSDLVSFSEDPMGPFKGLSDRCSIGYLTTNVYGGGTISPEAEFLTGLNTKYYVSSAGIYVQTDFKKLPSLADYFHAMDYDTTFIHPYYGGAYKRERVYEQYGFDHVLFDESMEYRDIYSKYISDDSLADQIIAEYEKRGDDRKFIWAISMANHKRIMDYSQEEVKDYPYPISVETEAALSAEDQTDLVNYVNGIYYASLAYEKLVDYFSKVDEPVIVVMFGDHIPNYSAETIKALGLDMNDNSTEMLKKLYSVPVACYSNCMDEYPVFQGENISYLSEMLFEKAGLPDSNMTRILRVQRDAFRTNSRDMMTDGNGERFVECNEDQIRLIRHLKAVEYDILFSEQPCLDLWAPVFEDDN